MAGPLTFWIRTYGCQMNARDSEAVAALMAARGHVPACRESDAGVVIVNTCSVRGKAEDKALGKLGLLVAARRGRAGRLVGAIGCVVERLQEEMFNRVPGLDFAVGTRRLGDLPAAVERAAAGRGPVLLAGGGAPSGEALGAHAAAGPCAFVNILIGCDRRCAYCVVPQVRGGEWSRPAAEIVEEVRRLAAEGVRDITLLGQSVMAYGRRSPVWPEGTASPGGYAEPLPRLLEALNGVPGVARLRFTSGHPDGCTEELARCMAELPAVCEHLHLPLQSGSDRILRLMRRGYAVEEYRQAAARLRRAVPGMALTTDAIVGFPTESEGDFEATRAFMDEMGFDNAFVFKYSPRPGTPAEALPDDVPAAEKLRRNKVLLADQDRRRRESNRRLVGTGVEVLVEGVSARNAARWSGRTRSNQIVVFEPSPGVAVGDLVRANVSRATPQTLYAEV